MPRRKRQASTFNLSFLDIMSCGFGAVVLVFLIIDHSLEIEIQTVNAEVLSEVNLLEDDIREGEAGLVRLRNALDEADLEIVEADGLARRITEDLDEYEALIAAMSSDQTAQMATPVLQVDPVTYGLFTEDRRNGRVGGTTAIFDHNSNALYFSKEVLPFLQLEQLADKADIPVYHHVGVYAYRPEALKAYMQWPEGRLEKLEGLEQLRFLENAAQVKCVEVDARGKVFWELNNPEDMARIEKVLEA